MMTLEEFEKECKPKEIKGYYQEQVAECFKDRDTLNIADIFATYRCLYFSATNEKNPPSYRSNLLLAIATLDILINVPTEEIKKSFEKEDE
jgi:hypothetical protein